MLGEIYFSAAMNMETEEKTARSLPQGILQALASPAVNYSILSKSPYIALREPKKQQRNVLETSLKHRRIQLAR